MPNIHHAHDNKPNNVHFQFTALVDPSPCLSLLSRWNAELAGFYCKRAQQYWSLPLRLLSCRSSDEAVGVQVDFYHQLIEDYRQETETLHGIVAQGRAHSEPEDVAPYAARLLKAQEDAREIVRQAKAQADRIIASARKEAAAPAADTGETTVKAA
jgi:hypothetical protein